jgi:methyltransferase
MALPPVPHTLFVGLVLLTAAQRLRELIRSRVNQGTMQEAGFARQDSFLSYYAMVAVHASWLVAALVESSFWRWSLPATLTWTALVLFVAAQALRLWTIQTLGVQWNVNVMSPTQGAPPSALELNSGTSALTVVSSGPYAYVRHPNYLAVLIEFMTLPLVGGAVGTACVWSILNGAVLWRRITIEERHLRTRPGYDELTARIPCLIPRSITWRQR